MSSLTQLATHHCQTWLQVELADSKAHSLLAGPVPHLSCLHINSHSGALSTKGGDDHVLEVLLELVGEELAILELLGADSLGRVGEPEGVLVFIGDYLVWPVCVLLHKPIKGVWGGHGTSLQVERAIGQRNTTPLSKTMLPHGTTSLACMPCTHKCSGQQDGEVGIWEKEFKPYIQGNKGGFWPLGENPGSFGAMVVPLGFGCPLVIFIIYNLTPN